MKLKRLDITGFKSFCEKVSIEFPAGISAIVGPNGCGKSNLVDAIRWVMGEQSVKQLRGKIMEDVIFAGAGGIPPVNMAEVSLTLLNDNGTAPEELKEFSEIMITRRVFRSGERVYLLNKRPCRLKDIYNLFLGSGMGAKSYAVIQQGNIGAITEAEPGERRVFIEEAAGITRYQKSKIEALRKVGATNQNLLRVEDIIVEVKRHMSSLKRQARKAELYQSYRERIKRIDILLAIDAHHDLSGQITDTDKLLKSLRDDDLRHTSKIKRLDAAVEELKLLCLEKNQNISEQHSAKIDAQRKTDRLENDLEHLRNEMLRLKDELLEQESAQRGLNEKYSEITAEIEQIQSEEMIFLDKMEKNRASLCLEQKKNQNIKNSLSELNQKLDKHKNTLLDSAALEAGHRNIYQNAAVRKEKIERRLKRADEDVYSANKRIEEAAGIEQKAKKFLEQLSGEENKLDDLIKQIKKEHEKKRQVLSSQIKLVQSMELERGGILSELTALKKMDDNYAWYQDAVKAIMKAKKTNFQGIKKKQPEDCKNNSQKLSENIICLVADIIEPDPLFGTAVETVLGEALQYIIVKDIQTCLQLIEYLKQNSLGSSGFIPLPAIQADIRREWDSSILNDYKDKLLLNHVKAKPGFEKIPELFLYNAVVADTFEEARSIAMNSKNLCTVVTADGIIITPEGIITGGGKDTHSGILAQKQKIKDLQNRLTEFDKNLESEGLRKKNLENEIRSVEIEMQSLIQQKKSINKQKNEAEQKAYKASGDLKHSERHLDIISLEQEQLSGDAIDIDDEIEESLKAYHEIQERVGAARERIAETKKSIEIILTRLDGHNRREMDLKLKLTALNAGLGNNRNTLKRLDAFRKDKSIQIKELMLDIKKKGGKLSSSGLMMEQYKKNLTDAYENIKTLTENLNNYKSEYIDLEARLKEYEKAISKMENQQDEVLGKMRILEIEQTQKIIKLENIETRLGERYHKSIAELKKEFIQNRQESGISSAVSRDAMEKDLLALKKKLEKFKDVNMGAIKEYEQIKVRYDFLCEQRDDLVTAIEDLNKVIKKINRITKEKFLKTFNLINDKLSLVFPKLFGGGKAKLSLTEPDNILETGVELMVHPPGKKLRRLSLLSGGEKALSAIAFIFAIFLIRPASFCLMDEIDAPLDEANIFRFNNLLQLVGDKSQIVMITHNKKSMEFADTLFGITMEKKGVSKIVSVNLATVM